MIDKNKFRYIQTNEYYKRKTKIKLKDIRNKSIEEVLGKEESQRVIQHYQKCVDEKKQLLMKKS